MLNILTYIFSTVLFLSMAGGLVTLTVLVATAVGKRLSPSLRYYLWLLPIAAFLVVVPRVSAPRIIPEKSAADTVVAPVAGENNTAAETDLPQADTSPTILADNTGGYTPARPARNYTGYIAAAYIVIAAALLLRIPMSRMRFSRKMRRLSVPDEILSRECGVFVRQFSGRGTPFATGVFRPIIYLPEWRGEDEALMLRHELIHIRRRDLLFKLLADVAAAVHFFNPLVYVMKSRIDHYCELSCDEAAVKGMTDEERGSYARMILSFAAASASPRFTAALTEDAASVKERIVSITKPRRKSVLTAAVSVVLAIVLAIGSATIAAEVSGRNTAMRPRLAYAGVISNAGYEIGNPNGYITVTDGTPAVYFSNVLGRTTFRTAFMAFDRERFAEYADYVGETREFRFGEYIDFEERMRREAELEAEKGKPENYVHTVEIELLKVDRSYGGVFFEGDFSLRIDGEESVVRGRLSNMPPHLDYLFLQPQLQLEVDGTDLDFYMDFDSYDAGAADSLINEKNYYLEQNFLSDGSGTTRKIKFTHDGYESEINYNLELGLLNGSVAIRGENGVTRIELATLSGIADDGMKGEMYVTGYSGLFYGVSDVTEFTVSNIGGAPGETLTISGGGYELECEIVEYEIPVCHYSGTRSVREFSFGDEPVFVGTPFEQEEFDKKHRGDEIMYNRIFVDDEGRVMFILPIEWQASPDNVFDQASYINDGASFVSSQWNDIIANAAYGDVDGMWVLLDGLTGELKALVPPENQFIKKEEF